MLLLKDAIMEYELECKVRRLSQGTIDNYDRQLRYMRRYLEDECGVTQLEDVKPAHLKRFLLEKEERGRKARIAARDYVAAVESANGGGANGND